MTLYRIVWTPKRKPRPTHARVCSFHPGVGCPAQRPRGWVATWCPSCRRLRAERDEARKAKRRKA